MGEEASGELVDCAIRKNGRAGVHSYSGKFMQRGGTVSKNKENGVHARSETSSIHSLTRILDLLGRDGRLVAVAVHGHLRARPLPGEHPRLALGAQPFRRAIVDVQLGRAVVRL